MASGKATDENDRQVYLKTNPINHRVLRRWEIENYLFDKSVLAEYCAAEGLAFDEIGYDQFVSDIINQNLKDEVGRIKNFCGIKGSINAEQFKFALSEYVTEGKAVYRELEGCIFKRS